MTKRYRCLLCAVLLGLLLFADLAICQPSDWDKLEKLVRDGEISRARENK